MTVNVRVISSLVITAGLVFGSQSWALAKKGPKISVGDDPSIKNGSPAFVLVEVTDYQCPYCGEGAREVMPQVYEAFISTEKLELIFLDLPLQMHPHAFKAAEAAACADDQKAFWYMHGLLFANQQALAPDRLPAYAEELGLDVAAFQKCLSSGQHAGAIREDMRTVQVLGITSTPAFLLGRRLPGGDKVEILEIVRGLPPYEVLKEKLDALLTSK